MIKLPDPDLWISESFTLHPIQICHKGNFPDFEIIQTGINKIDYNYLAPSNNKTLLKNSIYEYC